MAKNWPPGVNQAGIIYEITGEEPRVIISNEEKGTDVVVSKATVLTEYLVTFRDKIIHLLLLDKLLSTAQDEDSNVCDQLITTAITSFAQAEKFLRKFRCHRPMLWEVDQKVKEAADALHPSSNVDLMQNILQDTLIHCWELLLKRHSATMQIDAKFQDLLFRALDYYVVGRLHEMLWWLVCERCQVVDQLVKTRLSHLRHAHLSALQLGVPAHYYTPLPAAVVELASLASVESAIGRLQCVHSTIELIQAQAKEARVTLHQYKDQEGEPELELTKEELMALLTTVVVQAQCSHLVANIYYMTHYVFSVTEDDPLWKSLGLLRNTLENIMKLDVARLPQPAKSIRKELSLQDLMQVSAEVESRFEAKGPSRSIGDITALDLQLHQLTQQIQLSTQAHSETHLTERNSPSRRSDRTMLSPTQDNSKSHSFREFLSSIPSSLRESLRRRQSQQRSAIQSSLNG
ncbi:Ankyrin repeat domain-containing protein 27 [Penaeus vannamei]|uniref:Ankyrin repeat domain-containing protein 27 n=1 Tax=Penaeus vannamei TaxID=6689 RepID=A0A423STA8_PENVA|nr:Ankyrin repeat domain-containing protein 27 [Penaeus vannamei]